MRSIAEEADALCRDGRLTPATLLALGTDHIVNGRKLSELFASGCMKAEDISDSREAEKEAFRLYAKMRIRRLQEDKENATAIIASQDADENAKDAAKQNIRRLTNEIKDIKSKL
jgi:hypothetical protein